MDSNVKITETLPINLILLMFLCPRIAWLVGWALVLDYTIGGSAIARGITPNLVFISL